jgi:hypothetical protein
METGEPYAYTGDDPVNAVDPLGLFGCSSLGFLGLSSACHNTVTAVKHSVHDTVHVADTVRHFVAAHKQSIITAAIIVATLPLDETGIGEASDAEAVAADVTAEATEEGVVDELANEGAGEVEDVTRVGRWMSSSEYDAMVQSGTVQEGSGGVTSVSNPANVEEYMQQAVSGSTYAEFDVPTDTLSPGGKVGWSTIRGPNSWYARYGLALNEMPPARAIEWIASKI